jgi:hypothetical protein
MTKPRRSLKTGGGRGTLGEYFRTNTKAAEFLKKITNATVVRKTSESYRRWVMKVGGYDPISFIKFLQEEYEKPNPPVGKKNRDRQYRYATQTIRCMKSASVHVAMLSGEPWGDSDQDFTELCLTGLEATGASPMVRGNLSLEQFQVYLDHCRATGRAEYADAAVVQWGTGVRPRDILALCLDRTFVKDSGLLGVGRAEAANCAEDPDG